MNTIVAQKLDRFFLQFRLLSFKKGEILIRAGDPITAVYYLKKGLVRQYLNTEQGDDITLHMFRPPSYLPIMLVLSNSENVYNFEAAETVEVFKAPKDETIAFLKREPEVLFDLTTRLSQGISGLLTKIEKESYKNAYQKIVSLLLYLAQRFGERDEQIEKADLVTISVPLTHNDIASWVGIRRETVSRQLEQLQKKGLVDIHHQRLIIPNINGLESELVN